MAQRKLAAFRLDPEIIAGLEEVKQRDGVPVSEQVRRALVAWLETKRVNPTAALARRSQPRRPAARPGRTRT